MNKIALTAAAILVATGTAFAGSDHYNADANQQAAPVDTTVTASTSKSVPSIEVPVTQGADRNLFGR